MSQPILIVDDEESIRVMLAMILRQSGFESIAAADAAEAIELMRRQPPALVLLDWMLPGLSGVDFARRLKRDPEWRDLPIIMLTARGEEPDKVRGLEAGADDYVTKPFSARELTARIRAVLRRSAGEPQDQPLSAGTLRLDPATHRVEADGAAVDLGPTEFRLLQFFMRHPERVFSRAQILDRVWGHQVVVEERTVDVHIRRLRQALEPHGCAARVQTVRGAGYRFVAGA